LRLKLTRASRRVSPRTRGSVNSGSPARRPWWLAELHRLLQFLGWPEGDLLAGFDLDRFAGSRVPTHPRRSLAHLEDAETCQADFVTLLEVLRGQRHQVAQHGLSLFLREVVAIGQLGGEMLERDSRLRRGFRWGCLGPAAAFLAAGADFFAGGMMISFDRFVAACSPGLDSNNPAVAYIVNFNP
jgi:hypothetical protein